ncbi:unnamed protein product [Adineta ricciae]|uniref:F-box domain-containing protein n=1 Tax=Adineta ricciae TaxID=249248 RepID=A0A814KBQ8_ADIRI|nr:unnamed protein product [Adineta ricciae]
MTGWTLLEDLPVEVWFTLFSYLNAREQFHSFFNLKSNINQLLLNYYHRINLKFKDKDSDCVLEHVLRCSSQSGCISSLRLDNINKMNIFHDVNCLHFPNLRSLTLCNLHVTNDILNLLRYYAPSLEYLNVSSFVSSKWVELLKLIISFSKLRTCYLNLNMILCCFRTELRSPLKHLIFPGADRTCQKTNLANFLEYFPSLESLHIECRKIINNDATYESVSVSNLSLQLSYLPESFNDFMSFVLTIASHVKKFQIKCCHSVSNILYLKVFHWMRLIDSLDSLNELILIITPGKNVTEKSWKRRCDELMELTKVRNIHLQIISIKN